MPNIRLRSLLISPSSPVCRLAHWGQAFRSGLSERKDPFGHNWDVWEWAACSAVCLPGLFAKCTPHSFLLQYAEELNKKDKQLCSMFFTPRSVYICDRTYIESFSTLFSLIDHPTLPPFTLQDSVRSLKWDPTGHLLLCLGRSEVVTILGRSGGTWVTLHSLIHPSTVNIAEWCPLAGRAPDPRLMMAAWVYITNSSLFICWIFSVFLNLNLTTKPITMLQYKEREGISEKIVSDKSCM